MEKLEGCVIKAMKLSMEAHANQKDKAGESYFLHPVTVAMTLAKNGYSDECIATALLHDVVEDTPYTLEQLSEMGFSKNIITALSLLTHKDDVPYMNYVKAAKSNPIARAVKMGDLLHNMDTSRLKEITDWDKQRLEKYQKAFELLQAE